MTSRGSTTFRQVHPAVVDGDPFWSTAIREHPDATYVLLPPVVPAEQPADPLAPADAVAAITPAVTAWRLVAPLVAAAGQPGEPALGWRGSPGGQRLHVEISLVGIGRAAGIDLLGRVGLALGERGWLLAPERLPDRSILQSYDGSATAHLFAVAGDGATVLSFSSPPIAVDPQVAADLRAEVRTWL